MRMNIGKIVYHVRDKIWVEKTTPPLYGIPLGIQSIIQYKTATNCNQLKIKSEPVTVCYGLKTELSEKIGQLKLLSYRII